MSPVRIQDFIEKEAPSPKILQLCIFFGQKLHEILKNLDPHGEGVGPGASLDPPMMWYGQKLSLFPARCYHEPVCSEDEVV